MLDLEDMNTTEQEAYSMSVSVALQTLNEIMLNEDTPIEEKRWAAELILRHSPTLYEIEIEDEEEEDDEDE